MAMDDLWLLALFLGLHVSIVVVVIPCSVVG
jgi:hypothetical protein